ncbi:MAG: VWA domain-containing protein [Gemmatimonadetes bacterium]|nr:VWA domain-containing protein [Gemmatimonadota bacterium]MBT5145403.1 VWA domain-containing protein [Gemmatimonadota bacterium]MBT5591591.1 VWA domain-containing protein [Gemmatimonadota bacterium]MBT5961954.1 VWA domain-containing protein [Gemmatimonadota bacterium]MBT7452891.1 VWA domain-containing protein [Gemmatimonadota bacterium]
MQFLNPLALIGLAAAAIPLALHLLHRGRPRAVPFSNLPFLRQLHQTRMRSVRLRQWWVLLLRTLALLALALAFARPAVQGGSSAWFATPQPRTAVLLLDQSYSVSARLGSESVFDQLRRRAREVTQLFDEADRLVLVGFSDRADLPSSTSKDRLRQQIDAMTPGQGSTNLARALTRAYQLLAQSDDRDLELYLLTDMTRPGWQAPAVAPPPGLRTFVLPPGQRPASNAAVVAVSYEPWLTSPGSHVDLSVQVRFHGPVPSEAPGIDLYVDDERVQRRSIDLGALRSDGDFSVADVPFSIAPRRGGRLRAFAQIDADALTADDRFHFIIDAPDSIRILLIGETATSTYYARRALSAATLGDQSLQVQTLRFAQATDEDWSNAHVVILCNVEHLQETDLRRLRLRIDNGGGVMVFPGPDAQLQHLNRDVLPALLPVSLGTVRGQQGQRPTLLDTLRLHHSLFAGLDFGQAPTTTTSFDLVADPTVQVLASFADERPALVEGRFAGGRVILWSVPLDLAWSQWPESGWFLPVLQRLSRHLAINSAADRAYHVSDHAWRRLAGVDTETQVQAYAPSGQRRFVETERVFGELRWKVPHLSEAGFWSLRPEDQPRSDQSIFAVNVDPSEADLRSLHEDDVSRTLGESAVVIDAQMPLAAAVTDLRVGREMWRELLALAGLLLMVELWVSRSPSMKDPATA